MGFLQRTSQLLSRCLPWRGPSLEAWRRRHWIEKAVAGIDAALIATDREGRVMFLNTLAEAVTGRSLARAYGCPLGEVLPLADERTQAPLAEPIPRIVKEGQPTGWLRDAILTPGDGRVLPVEYRAAPIQDRDGHIQGTVLLVRDLSGRRRVQQVMAQLAAIVESTEDAIVGVALDGTITNWNAGAERLYGHAAEEAVGQPVALIYPPEHAEELAGSWAMLNAGAAIRHDDTIRLRRDGTTVEVSVSLSPIRGEDGAIVGFSSIGRDMTARKRAEEEARRTEVLRRLSDAQERERCRIARELHDRMGQHLAALKLGLERLKLSPKEPERFEPMLDLIREIGQDIRHIALELRPTALDDLGLASALAHYVAEWSERTGIEVDFYDTGLSNGHARVPPPVETAVYRVVQEALTNVLLHARANRVTLILERRADHFLTIIEDDGRGFDYEAVMHGSGAGQRLGLLGMTERVAAVRGELQVETGPDAGTSLFIRIPLPEHGKEVSARGQASRAAGR